MLHLLPVAILAQLADAFALSCSSSVARSAMVQSVPRLLHHCVVWLRLVVGQPGFADTGERCAWLGSNGELEPGTRGVAQPVAVAANGLGCCARGFVALQPCSAALHVIWPAPRAIPLAPEEVLDG